MNVGTAIRAGVRSATTADLAAITAIYAEEVAKGTATFEIVPPDEAEMGRRMDLMLAGGFPYLVAEEAGRVVGYAYAAPYRDRPAYRNTVEDSIYLLPKARSRGVGGLLLGRLIEEATKAQFRQMIAVIGDSENTASVRLHKAAGFELVGTLKDVGFKHGRWLDTVTMQLALGPGAKMKPTR